MIPALAQEWFWILSLGLTLLIEVGTMLVVRSWGALPGKLVAVGPLILVLVGLNLATHPLAWQASNAGVPWVLSEASVVLIEAVGLALIVPGLRRWDAAKLSLWINAASGLFGLGMSVFLN
ncbi:MAG: hypothetical protein Q8M16_15090 [Pirellulaceae bacterium]|nr:hypothetical protein [Pirellulaceae bacterium]